MHIGQHKFYLKRFLQLVAVVMIRAVINCMCYQWLSWLQNQRQMTTAKSEEQTVMAQKMSTMRHRRAVAGRGREG